MIVITPFYKYTFYQVEPLDVRKEFTCSTPYGFRDIYFTFAVDHEDDQREIEIIDRDARPDLKIETKEGMCIWPEGGIYSCLDEKFTFNLSRDVLPKTRVDNDWSSSVSLIFSFEGVYHRRWPLSEMQIFCRQTVEYASFTRE